MTLLFTQGHNFFSQTWHDCLTGLYFNSHISDSIDGMAFTLGMTVDLCMAYSVLMLYWDPNPEYISNRLRGILVNVWSNICFDWLPPLRQKS